LQKLVLLGFGRAPYHPLFDPFLILQFLF